MKELFVIILLLLNINLLTAQKQLRKDTSNVIIRSFSNSELQQFKKDKDFQYSSLTEPSKGLWEKFWNWAWWRFYKIMHTKTGRTTVWTILIGFGVVAIVFFVIKVMGMSNGGLFARDAFGEVDYTTEAEDINRISFDKSIKEAIENNNFRLATRLLYLQSLKQLCDRRYIKWNANKTNNDYISEVAGRPWQLLFKKLTNSFEHIWYGEINVAHEEFKNLQMQFQQFNNQL